MKSVIKPCVVALHLAKIQQVVRQLNKPRYRLEGIHLENHVVLLMLSCMFNTKNIYEISKFDDYKITSRWIILYGNFEYTEIYKGKNNSSSSTKIVKIARAFDTDKEIIDFIKKNSTK